LGNRRSLLSEKSLKISKTAYVCAKKNFKIDFHLYKSYTGKIAEFGRLTGLTGQPYMQQHIEKKNREKGAAS
jgi:hypothetical protein